MHTVQTLIFSSLGDKEPKTARKVHIRRLFDVLQLSIQRGDLDRAQRAWSILVRCKEVDWQVMWKLGAMLVGRNPGSPDEHAQKLDFLSTIMLRNPGARQEVFQELILRYIRSGQHRKALDELDLYLPSQPYESNPVLHIYAGLICLYLSQPRKDVDSAWDQARLRGARVYLEKARALDPNNFVVPAWLGQIPAAGQEHAYQGAAIESDEESPSMRHSPTAHQTKRMRH